MLTVKRRRKRRFRRKEAGEQSPASFFASLSVAY